MKHLMYLGSTRDNSREKNKKINLRKYTDSNYSNRLHLRILIKESI